MRKFSSLAMVSCVGAVCLTASVAQSSATALGTNCVERWPYNVGLVYFNNAVLSASYSEPTTVPCPIAVDHDIGNSAQFKVVVHDYSSDDNFACYAVAYDSDGVLQGSSSTQYSSGSSGAATSLTMSISGVNPGSTWAYAVICTIPSYPSQIVSMRAY